MIGGAVLVIDVWVLIAVNFFAVVLCGITTVVSFWAYLSYGRNDALRNATVGFGLITAGVVVEPAYQIGVEGSHVLASEQNVLLQILEGTILALGFLVLFFSIYQYGPRTRRQTVRIGGIEDDFLEESE